MAGFYVSLSAWSLPLAPEQSPSHGPRAFQMEQSLWILCCHASICSSLYRPGVWSNSHSLIWPVCRLMSWLLNRSNDFNINWIVIYNVDQCQFESMNLFAKIVWLRNPKFESTNKPSSEWKLNLQNLKKPNHTLIWKTIVYIWLTNKGTCI